MSYTPELIEDLQTSEIRYRRLFESACEGILILDAATRKIIDVNPYMMELLGYTREEFLDKELWEIGLLKDEEESIGAFKELQKNGYIRYEDLPLENKNGERREVEFVSNVYTENNRQVIQCNIRDISERKHNEEALKKVLKRERAMIENALDVICTIDKEGKFVSVNPASLKVWGYQPEELIGQPYIELVAPEDDAKTNEAVLEVMSGSEARDFENRYIHKNGSLVNVMWTAFWSEKDGLMFCVGHDITERKAAENEMRLMKSAVDSIVEGIVISDPQKPDNPIIYTNAAFENLTGYAFDEIKGQNCRFLQGAETNPRTVDEIREALEKVTTFRGEILNYHKNGDSFWNELKISPVFDQSDRLTNFVGIQRDISKRKKTEETLRESEEKFRSIVETTSEWIWAFDSQGNCSYSNPALETILGYVPEEVLGKSFLPLMHEEEREKIRQLMPTLIADKRGWTNLVLRWYHKDGSIRYLESNALPLFNSGGEVVGYRGSDRDITESKRIEEEKRLLTVQIEQQHERLNNIVANVPGVVWEAWGEPDAATQRIDFVSDYVETLLGYTVEEWITTPNFWLSIVHPEDKERIAREAAERFHAGEGYTRQFRWVARDGRIVWVESQATVIRDESGQPIGLRGINIDITERKRLEEERTELIAELDFEKARLQHIFDNSPSFIVSLGGSELVFEMANPAYHQLVGHRNLIGIPASEALPEVMTQGLSKITRQVYNTGEPFIGNEVPVKLQPQDGSELKQHYLNFVCMPLREADDSISGIISYGVDVTEQVLSRIKIQESEERYRFLFENNPLPMWVFDVDTLAFLSVNDAAVQHYGYSQEEFLALTMKDIRPPEEVPVLLEHTKNPFPGIDKAGVFKHRKKDGTIIYVEIVSKPINL